MTHSCIKCSNKYESDEAEAYYCPPCKNSKQAIAEQIDKKFANRPTKHTPNVMEQLEALPKIPGTNIPYIQ